MKKIKKIDVSFNEELIIKAISNFDVEYRSLLKYLIITQGNILFPFMIVSKHLIHELGDNYELSEAYIRRYAIMFICYWLYTETNKNFAYYKDFDKKTINLTEDIQIDDFIIKNDSDKKIVEDLIAYTKKDNDISVDALSRNISDVYSKYSVKLDSKNNDKIKDKINNFLDCGKEFYFMVKEKEDYSVKGKCFEKKYLRYDELLANAYLSKEKELIKFNLSIDENNYGLYEKIICNKFSNADKKKLGLSILGIIIYNVLNGNYSNNEIECPNSKTIKFYLNNKNYSLTKGDAFIINCFDLVYKEDEKVVVILKNIDNIDDFEFTYNSKKYTFKEIFIDSKRN